MNLKTSFLATLSVALFAFSANAEVIHESDFEAETVVGFSVGVETMLFNDAGGDLIGFSANNNPLMSGESQGVSDTFANSGSFSYVVDVSQTTPGNGTANGWGASWCGANTENGSGGFSDQATAIADGSGCYVDFSAGATFTATCQVATNPNDPLTGTATAEIRLEFNDGPTGTLNILPRVLSTQLGATALTSTFQELTVSYTLTQADVDAIAAAGQTLSCSAVMAIEGAGHESSTGLVHFDDFVFEVNAENVVVVGDGHADVEVLKGDVDLDGSVTFLDINPFIGVLSSNGSQAEADCNCDGTVDFLDIQPFIDILAGN